jgi:hypothetical protein
MAIAPNSASDWIEHHSTGSLHRLLPVLATIDARTASPSPILPEGVHC